MTEDLLKYAANILPDSQGGWVSQQKHSVISYPKEGHAIFAKLEESSFWFNHRNDVFLQVLRKYPPPGQLLDIGGGNGYVSRALVAAGYQAVLLEPGEEGAAYARSTGMLPVICASFEDAGFRDRSIKAAGMFDVLEHIEDDVAFLKKIRCALAKDARFYVAIPASPLLWSAEDDDAGHFRRYTRMGLVKILEDADFEVEYCSHLFSFLFLPVLFARSMPYRFGKKLSPLSVRETKAHAAPPPFLGKLLFFVRKVELSLLRRQSLPFGTSIVAVARPR